MKQWKETAINREKKLVETQLQRDVLAAQLSSRPSDGDAKSQEEALREVTSMVSDRIGSVKTFEDLTRAQLETDLSNVSSGCYKFETLSFYPTYSFATRLIS
ncbi:hypothetical protein ANCDUO_24052 [Ancylostoma duodenale]|uniref:Uncharacterized protein n=1 Tax=Ancylostoma duodenale TaxID=51022 RepID=A0A0C2C8A4_9BILA|nr:hypothetical protein ANCDUO_24052 [Ancylostoma duodenale]